MKLNLKFLFLTVAAIGTYSVSMASEPKPVSKPLDTELLESLSIKSSVDQPIVPCPLEKKKSVAPKFLLPPLSRIVNEYAPPEMPSLLKIKSTNLVDL